ncbi:hypothetical protein L3Y34_014638 [Caenorhabditis briggsae]|nr:hypothetical protein L3Y34_014638 [Caenorhabditis briggsae]
MVFNLQFGHEPVYSVLVCSFFKNFCSSTTSAYQVLPFAVSLYRYRTVVLKGHPSPSFVINVHSLVTFIFIIYAFLNYPLGQNNTNDVCYILRFSNGMELVRIFSTLLFNFAAIIVNCVILRFVKHFERIPMPASFGSTWYALTFLGPFLMPLSSILGIKSTRKELLDTMLCGCFPRPSVGNNQIKSAVTVILASRMERSTFTVRDDD